MQAPLDVTVDAPLEPMVDAPLEPTVDAPAFGYRPYRSGDERQLVALFKDAFGALSTEAHWRWKLRHDTGVDNVWLAFCGERPVFQYAGIPTRLWMAPTTVACMVSVDTMTAPDYRRRGLLTEVGRRAYDSWRDHGVSLVIGLPNEQWGTRASALGWQPLFPLQWLVRPLRPEALLARRLKFAPLMRVRAIGRIWNRWLRRAAPSHAGVTVERLHRAEAEFDLLWDACKDDWTFAAVRDRRWMDWRFFSGPSRQYTVTAARRDGRLSGFAAHSIVDAGGHAIAQLAELFSARADLATRHSLLDEVLEGLCGTEVEALVTLAVPGSANFAWLRRQGFMARRSFGIQFVPLAADLPIAKLRDPLRWHLSGADFDVV